MFITKYGQPWVKYRIKGNINSVSLEFGKLMNAAKIKRKGVGFYALRHTFETIAGQTGDQAAVDRAMGHERPDMAALYREWVKDAAEDARLKRVADHVHNWLYPSTRKPRASNRPTSTKSK